MNKRNLMSRRSALVNIARFGALTVVASIGVFTQTKRRRLLREGKCISNNQCANCQILSDCSLPLALSQKSKSGGAV